ASIFAGCTHASGDTPTGERTFDMNQAPSAGKSGISTAQVQTTDTTSTTKIAFQGNSIVVDGPGAAVNKTTVTITTSGNYHLTGALTDGQIIVNAGKRDIVRLILDNVDIRSESCSPLLSLQSDKLIVTLADGTTNYLSDPDEYTFDPAEIDGLEAALYCKGPLQLDGTGTLVVQGNGDLGIASSDSLIISSGNFEVFSAGTGILAKDSLSILSGRFTVKAGVDAIRCDRGKDGGDEFSGLHIRNGAFEIVSERSGLSSGEAMSISGGTIRISAAGGPTDVATAEASDIPGLSARGPVVISGGKLEVESPGDAIYSKDDIDISNGILTLNSGAQGIRSEGALSISGGTMNMEVRGESLNGNPIAVSGGAVFSDSGATSQTEPGSLRMNGGFICATRPFPRPQWDASQLHIRGGIFLLSSPVLDTAATDDASEPEVTVSGGTFVYTGDGDAVPAVRQQGSIVLYYQGVQPANQLLYITNASGTPVLVYAPSSAYRTVVISSSLFRADDAYTIYAGGQAAGEETGGFYPAATVCSGGREMASFTFTDSRTEVELSR
ncbi:carbohydrate-binding domain-containing protein, partial [Ruminococcaceae bacterium OttesenSCG-928-L11]|nr:carbohydrate-binding domain-containing protein [Ruminococcaceae bacterium OttesenSCG-928-L11]